WGRSTRLSRPQRVSRVRCRMAFRWAAVISLRPTPKRSKSRSSIRGRTASVASANACRDKVTRPSCTSTWA
ncbi:Ferredoxin II, partial [Dysosmobacter welbionis]